MDRKHRARGSDLDMWFHGGFPGGANSRTPHLAFVHTGARGKHEMIHDRQGGICG